jgi:hypothetical protein
MRLETDRLQVSHVPHVRQIHQTVCDGHGAVARCDRGAGDHAATEVSLTSSDRDHSCYGKNAILAGAVVNHASRNVAAESLADDP